MSFMSFSTRPVAAPIFNRISIFHVALLAFYSVLALAAVMGLLTFDAGIHSMPSP